MDYQINTYEQSRDICLLRFDEKQYFIGWFDLPQKQWTLEQYNENRRKSQYGYIALNSDYWPQEFGNSSLEIIETYQSTLKYYCRQFGVSQENSKEGKLIEKYTSFKGLLIELLTSQSNPTQAWHAYFSKQIACVSAELTEYEKPF